MASAALSARDLREVTGPAVPVDAGVPGSARSGRATAPTRHGGAVARFGDRLPLLRRGQAIRGGVRASKFLNALAPARGRPKASTMLKALVGGARCRRGHHANPGHDREGTTTDDAHEDCQDVPTDEDRLRRASGVLLAGVGAYAATNWVVGLNAGSSGEGQSATISNLTITAVASPAATNLLYPGGTGDVVVTISNPNPYPVTITAVQLPTNTTYATGYTTSALTTTQTGCSGRHAERGHLELLDRDERQLAHAHDPPDRRGERAGQQPAGGDAHQRRQHGDDRTCRLCRHLFLLAVLHRDHGDRWFGDLDDDAGHRRLDQLIDRLMVPAVRGGGAGRARREAARSSPSSLALVVRRPDAPAAVDRDGGVGGR